MSWKDLDIKLKAELIKLGVRSGVRDLKLIRLLYDLELENDSIKTLQSSLDYNEELKPTPELEKNNDDLLIEMLLQEGKQINAMLQMQQAKTPLFNTTTGGYNNQQPVLFRLFKNGGPIEDKRIKKYNNNSAGYLYDSFVTDNLEGGENPHNSRRYTISEELAEKLGYYRDEISGHRDDAVKLPDHPSHSSRGTFKDIDGYHIFDLTDKGANDVNYTISGLIDNGDDHVIPIYKGSYMLPEVTVTPNGNYVHDTYNNLKWHSNNSNLVLVDKVKKYAPGGYTDNQPISYKTWQDYEKLENTKQGILEGLAMLQYADNKALYGDDVPEEAKYLYDMGLLPDIEVTANQDLNKKELYLADLEWSNYLATHPIQIGSEEYNRLPERAKAQVYKNSVTDAIDKAALPTAAAIVAPTLLTSVGASVLPAVGNVIGTALANPIVDAALTVHGAVAAPENIKQGIQQIKNGEYWKGAFNLGLTGLDVLGAGNLIGRTGRMLNPNYRRLHAYNAITPAGYGLPFERFKEYVSNMWNNVEVDIKNPKWLLDLKKEYGERPQYGYTRTGEMLYPMENAEKIADEARQDAWAIYNGLPLQHGTYIKNSDGTYSYNMDKILNDSHNSFEIPYENLEMLILEGLAPIDFVTGAGGRVRFDSAGRLTENGDLVGNIFLEDVWDLHPFSRHNNKFFGNLLNMYLKNAIGTRKMRENVLNFREWMFDKGHWSIFNPENRTLFGKLLWPLDKHLNSYRIGAKVKKSKIPGLKDKIIEYTPIMDNIIDFITTNKLAKKIDDKLSLFEVGSITGGKPFTMKTTIPFIRERKSIKDSDVLDFYYALYPYFNDINIDLPLNLWEMKGYNDLYDIFGNAIK